MNKAFLKPLKQKLTPVFAIDTIPVMCRCSIIPHLVGYQTVLHIQWYDLHGELVSGTLVNTQEIEEFQEYCTIMMQLHRQAFKAMIRFFIDTVEVLDDEWIQLTEAAFAACKKDPMLHVWLEECLEEQY